MADNEDDDGGINITLGKLIAYPVGVLLLLAGLGGMATSVTAGVILLVAGVLALPIARSKIKEETGIGLNRWAASAIVIVLMFMGGGALSAADTGGVSNDAGSDTTDSSDSSDGVQLIEQPATELLPTIEAFESGWRGSVEDDGTASYFNVENENTVNYNVTVYDSVEEAEAALGSRQPENTATDDVSFGDGGFKYPIAENTYEIHFRSQNVVCETYFAGGFFGAEGTAEDMAEKCEASINN